MIDQPFRQWLALRVAPLISLYQRLRLTPNDITLIGCGFGLLAAVFVACGMNLTALLIWWLGRLFDGTDGIYARATNRVSDFGGYLDIVADMTAYGAMVIGFAVARPEYHWWWTSILFLYILCITSALALGSLERREGLHKLDNRSLRLAAGLAEGGETGIAYSLFLLLPGFTGALCVLWVVLLSTTVVARTLMAGQELKKE